MELKQGTELKVALQRELLIVPYGIETSVPYQAGVQNYFLLIVPYGIET